MVFLYFQDSLFSLVHKSNRAGYWLNPGWFSASIFHLKGLHMMFSTPPAVCPHPSTHPAPPLPDLHLNQEHGINLPEPLHPGFGLPLLVTPTSRVRVRVTGVLGANLGDETMATPACAPPLVWTMRYLQITPPPPQSVPHGLSLGGGGGRTFRGRRSRSLRLDPLPLPAAGARNTNSCPPDLSPRHLSFTRDLTGTSLWLTRIRGFTHTLNIVEHIFVQASI